MTQSWIVLRRGATVAGAVLTLSMGLNLAATSHSLADPIYTFTFTENPNQSPTVGGGFSIPVSDFSGATANTVFTLPTSDITALSMTENTHSFGLNELIGGGVVHFNMNAADVPQFYYSFNSTYYYDLVASPDGCEATTSCSYILATGNTYFISATYPGGGNEVFGAWSTTVSPGAAAIPLPATLPLFMGGLAALGLLQWRRKQKALAS